MNKTAKSIAWHEECLKNFELNLANKEQELVRLTTEVTRWREEVEFRKQQIAAAKAQGKTEYDADRFLVKKS